MPTPNTHAEQHQCRQARDTLATEYTEHMIAIQEALDEASMQAMVAAEKFESLLDAWNAVLDPEQETGQ